MRTLAWVWEAVGVCREGGSEVPGRSSRQAGLAVWLECGEEEGPGATFPVKRGAKTPSLRALRLGEELGGSDRG